MGITGMRVGELRKLSVADITPDGSVIRIHSKGAQDRVVYINDASLRGKSHQVLRFPRLIVSAESANGVLSER